jgi:hypothetical protein
LISGASGLAPSGQATVLASRPRPERGRAGIERGFQVVAERGGQGGAIALLGRHRVQGRREAALGARGGQLGQAPGLGAQAAQLVLDLAGQVARLGLGGGGLDPHGLGVLEGLAGGGQAGLGVGEALAGLGGGGIDHGTDGGAFGLGLVQGADRAGQAALGLGQALGGGAGPGVLGGGAGGQLLDLAVGLGARLLGGLGGGGQFGTAGRRGGDLGAQLGQLGVGAGQGLDRVLQALRLAGPVVVDAGEIGRQPLELGLGGLGLALGPVLLDGQLAQDGLGDRGLLAQRRHGGLGRQDRGLGGGGGAGGVLDGCAPPRWPRPGCG